MAERIFPVTVCHGRMNWMGRLTLILGICGYLIYIFQGILFDFSHPNTSDPVLLLIWGFIALFISMAAQILIHEIGHWIFGRLGGYSLFSFRTGPFLWIKRHGHVQFQLIPFSGSLGQCLMLPPHSSAPVLLQKDRTATSIPFSTLLYNLGGVMANLITSLAVLAWLIWDLSNPYSFGHILGWAFVICGAVLAASNGIPAENAGILNDGANTRELLNHPNAIKGYRIQLQAAAFQAEHKGPEQYPTHWFTPDVIYDLSTPLNTTVILLYTDYLLAQNRIEELLFYLQKLPYRTSASRMPQDDRDLLDLNILYCLTMLKERRQAELWMSSVDLAQIQNDLLLHPALYRTIAAVYCMQKENFRAHQAIIEFQTLSARYIASVPEKIAMESRLIEQALSLYQPDLPARTSITDSSSDSASRSMN